MREGLFIDDLYTPERIQLTDDDRERIRKMLVKLGVEEETKD